ncbi:MAG: beta-galactosidase [Defluviitaleaceae bacterium]|nr:beta-galactosidase [Defluviitaleaceae bacterium]
MIKTTAFYPEYLPREKWRPFLQKVKDGGISGIRFGEFAWGLLQPDEGVFDWTVFDDAFALCEEMGVKIILCTPTACPPIWLAEKYPDVLPVNEAGGRIAFGGRQHRCYNSPSMRKYTEIVVDELAKRYGGRKSLMAWQIDNELGAEHKYCHCPVCTAKFQQFLEDKYKTIEELNNRWMTTFWAQNYARFGQIKTPAQVEAYLPVKPHPSLIYEFLRFSSKSVVDFAAFQYDIIKRRSTAPVTTNQDDFSMADNTDWLGMFDKLDVAAFDIYTDKAYELGYYFDLARSVKGKPCWILEYGTGYDTAAMLDVAHEKGCELAGLFAFHPFRAGQEQGTRGLIDAFGNEAPGYYKYRDWQPKETVPARKTIYMRHDFDSSWSYSAAEFHTWEDGWAFRQARVVYQRYLIHTVYKAVYGAGYAADFPRRLPASDCEGRVMLLPMQIIYKEDLADQLLGFVRAGGVVIATNDLFRKNEDNAYLTELPPFYKELDPSLRAFFPDDLGDKFLEFAVGKGKVVIVDRKLDENGWEKELTRA